MSTSKITAGMATALLAPLPALAQNLITAPNTVSNVTDLLSNVICKGINWVFTFLIIIAIIFVLIAAFKYLTSAGDDKKISEANRRLIYAAVAIVVGILAKGFPYMIGSLIGASFSATCR